MVDRVFGFMVGVRDRFVKEGSLETVEEVVTMFREAFDKRAITHPTMPRFFCFEFRPPMRSAIAISKFETASLLGITNSYSWTFTKMTTGS